MGTDFTIGQFLGGGVLLDVLDGAQDGLWDWWGSGQEVGLWVESELVGSVDHLDGHSLRGDVRIGSAGIVTRLTLLLDLDTTGLLDIVGISSVGILVGQELGDDIIVRGGGQGTSEKGDDKELLGLGWELSQDVN